MNCRKYNKLFFHFIEMFGDEQSNIVLSVAGKYIGMN